MCAHVAYALLQVTGVPYRGREVHMDGPVEPSLQYVT